MQNVSSSNSEKALVPKLRFPGFTESWELHTVGEYLTESKMLGSNGKNAKKLTVKLWAKGIVEKNTIFDGSEHTQYYIRKSGQLMYGKLDFLNCAFGIVPPELNNYESTLDSPAFDINDINSNFLLNRIIQKNFYKKNGDIANGSRKAKRIHPDVFLAMELYVPSKDEQNKISNLLELIDKKIALQQQLIENLKLYKRGVNKSIFGNMNKWKQSAIKDIAKVSTGSSNTQDRDENGQYPFFIRSKNVAKSNKYIFDGEAILTIGDGQIGKVFHYYNGKFDCHQRVYMITNFHNINGKYLYHYFSSFFYERAMKMSAKNTVDSVRMEMITEMPIFIPQREVQEKIVYILDKIDGLIKSNQKTQNQLELYKRGLLQQLFI